MKNIPLLLGTIFGTLLLVVGIAVVFSNQQPALPAQNGEVEEAILLDGARHRLGAEDPVVMIVEFSDFFCPACASVAPLLKSVVEAYPDQVALVYRHFPLVSLYPDSQLVAQSSEVAAEEGLFWEYNELLYENQPAWRNQTGDELVATLSEYASQIGIDSDDFAERIRSSQVRQAVLTDLSLANQLGIQATPTIFVNGAQLSAPGELPSLVEMLIEQNNQEG